MVAVYPPPAVQRALAHMPAAEVKPSELHCTLAVFPLPDNEAAKEELRRDVRRWAESQPSLTGRINGLGVFYNPANVPNVLYAGIDAPSITDVRESLSRMLEEKGWAEDTDDPHGYTPHATLAYLDRLPDSLPSLPRGLRDRSFELDMRLALDGPPLELAFNPNQPRWPKGTPGGKGGQWVDTDPGSGLPSVSPDVPSAGDLRDKFRSLNSWPDKTQRATEVLGDADSTAELHQDAEGAYTPERQALHDSIVEAMIGDITPPEGKPEALLMAGGSGSGKGTLLRNQPEVYPGGYVRDAKGDVSPKNAVLIDPDAIKEKLPEYQELSREHDPFAATAAHQESGDVAQQLTQEGIRRGLNLVLDGTGDSGPGRFKSKFDALHRAGYDTSAVYTNVPTDVALERNIRRAEETARFVPPSEIKRIHAGVSRNFPDIATLPYLRDIRLYDTSADVPRLLAEGGAGRLEVLDSEGYRNFLDKRNEQADLAGGTGEPDADAYARIDPEHTVIERPFDSAEYLDGPLPLRYARRIGRDANKGVGA